MPANYEQPKDVVKRVRFFDGQFLQDQDFIDDQKYHIDRQRRPNRLLRVSGICEGLTLVVDTNQVKVAPGTALDNQGRLIVLSGDPFAVDLKDQTGVVDIFISYGDEESDITQSSNERTTQGTTNGSAQGAKGATRWWEKPRIEAVKDRSALKGENPIWLGRVTVAGSGTSRTVTPPTIDDREYSGIYLPSSASPFEAPVLRSGGNLNPKLAVLIGDLRIRGSTTDSTATALTVTNSKGTSLLTVRNDGDSTLNGKLTVNSIVSLKGSATATGLTVDSSGNVGMGGTLDISGALSFGSATRQVINLWSTGYGIGVQSSTQYFRTDKNFAWYKRGSHVDSELGAGTGGTIQMVIKDGNVGIGTEDPKGFQVTLPESSSKPGAGVTISGGVTGGNAKIELRNSGTGTPYIDFAKDANTTDFDARLILVEKEKLNIEGAALGINTKTPQAKLSINGGLHVGGDSDPGDDNLLVDGALSFGSITRQMVNLWGSSAYGIGVQNNTQYFRTDKNFAWYKGGAHTNDELSAGANGTVQMVIKDGNVGIGTNTPKIHLAIGDDDTGLKQEGVNQLAVYTNNKERLRVDANGNVGIGTTVPQGFHVDLPEANRASQSLGISIAGGTSGNASIELRSKENGTPFIDFSQSALDYDARIRLTDKDNLAIEGANLEVEGNLKISNDANLCTITVSRDGLRFTLRKSHHYPSAERVALWNGDDNWDYSSDLRLKTDIDRENNILARLMQLQVKNYRWKDDPEAPTKKIGFVAQDVQPFFPSLVSEVKHENGNETTLTLKYGAFGILAVGALKELKHEKDIEIAELKAQFIAEITEFKAKIQQLKELL